MKSHTFILALAIAASVWLPVVHAQNVPERLSYQGLVTDANGNPVGADQAVNRKVRFMIYDAATGGSPVWAEEQTVTVSVGEFSVAVGGGSGISGLPGSVAPASRTLSLSSALATKDKSYYLGVTIDDGSGAFDANDKEIAPRQQLLSGGFALRAKTAEAVESSAVNSAMIADSTIVANDLASNSVQTAKVQDSAITSAKIADGTLNTADLADAVITKDKINATSVGVWDVNVANVYRGSGYVGIGTNSPAYPLDIYGADYGEVRIRGGNVAQLRLEDVSDANTYWLHNNADRLYFLWNGGAGANGWLGDYPMVFKGANVGLGTADPSDRLHVMGNAKIQGTGNPVLSIVQSSPNAMTQLAIAAGDGAYAANASAGDAVLRNQTGGGICLVSGSDNYALRVDNRDDLNVGRRLMFNSHWADGSRGSDYGNILFEYVNGDYNDGQLVFETGDDGNEEMIFKQSSGERMRIADDGEVRIWGFDGLGALNVGYRSTTLSSYGRLTTDGASEGNLENRGTNLSVHAQGDIYASQFHITSDARLKNVLGFSDGAADLEILHGIRITDYIPIDHIAHGNEEQKKVIAQQVEEVFPQAVMRSRGVVPDIYQPATVSGGWVRLATDLRPGERVKLIQDDGETVLEVLEANPGAFRVALDPQVNKIFVYGREVEDVRAVDYDAISMLNVSATQELYRRLRSMEERLEAIEKRLGER